MITLPEAVRTLRDAVTQTQGGIVALGDLYKEAAGLLTIIDAIGETRLVRGVALAELDDATLAAGIASAMRYAVPKEVGSDVPVLSVRETKILAEAAVEYMRGKVAHRPPLLVETPTLLSQMKEQLAPKTEAKPFTLPWAFPNKCADSDKAFALLEEHARTVDVRLEAAANGNDELAILSHLAAVLHPLRRVKERPEGIGLVGRIGVPNIAARAVLTVNRSWGFGAPPPYVGAAIAGALWPIAPVVAVFKKATGRYA